MTFLCEMYALGIGGRLILKWMLRKQDVNKWDALMWHTVGAIDGLL